MGSATSALKRMLGQNYWYTCSFGWWPSSSGTGGGTTGDNDGVDVNLQDPIAVCSVSPGEVRPLVEEATWIGGDSYDPEGGTITQYTWSLVSKPTGSGINMPGGASANRTGFVADLAGEFTCWQR